MNSERAPHRRQHVAIAVRRFRGVVEQAGADHVIGASRAARSSHRDRRRSTGRARDRDETRSRRGLRLDNAAGDVARTRDRVIGVVRHAEAVEDAHHRGAGARRIGDEDRRCRPPSRNAPAPRRPPGRPRRRYAPRPRRRRTAHRNRRRAARNLSMKLINGVYSVAPHAGADELRDTAGSPAARSRRRWRPMPRRAAPSPARPCSASARTGRGGENKKPWPKRTS